MCAVQTLSLVLTNQVGPFITSAATRRTYPAVKPKRLAAVLAKLSRYGLSLGSGAGKEFDKGQARRAESEQVRRLP